MTKPKRYKRYSAEFKREAILRASEEGNTDKAVCCLRLLSDQSGHSRQQQDEAQFRLSVWDGVSDTANRLI